MRRATELLAELVAHRSPSERPSRELIDFLVAASGARPEETIVDLYDDGAKANLLLVRGGPVTDGAGLLLAGHVDVVPADEPEWETDPWTLTDRGDRWVGRGTADMKGFVALAVDCFRRAEAADLRAPLAVLLTSDEEIGCRGARHWTEARSDVPLPNQAVIGEPTALTPVRLHKGHLRLRLEIRGTPAHSGYPHRGRSANLAAGPALNALARLGRELAAERPEYGDRFGEVPYVALNVGTIRGGSAINVIPDRCVLGIGLRPLPGMSGDSLRRRVEATLADAWQGAEVEPIDWRLTVDNDSPPLLTRDDSPLLQQLRSWLGEAGDAGVSFSTDGGTLARLGLDCVLFGPGSIEVAHRPNEFLPKAEFEQAGAILDRLIDHFCRRGGP